MRINLAEYLNFDPNIEPELEELLKSSLGPTYLKRVRVVRTGRYMLRMTNKSHHVIAKSKPTKFENKSIKWYKDVLEAYGHKDKPELKGIRPSVASAVVDNLFGPNPKSYEDIFDQLMRWMFSRP
jgi:hypothetical protein